MYDAPSRLHPAMIAMTSVLMVGTVRPRWVTPRVVLGIHLLHYVAIMYLAISAKGCIDLAGGPVTTCQRIAVSLFMPDQVCLLFWASCMSQLSRGFMARSTRIRS
ncbi:unnamed protein product [Prorocentrum cordatum]|uniref:Very-long-chain 3-oxoacyl-CoA synthase n=1 Tax=Prorocentrum cordatum TaxID=2364126 RepID=A0ABN9RX28_9DINO|nr:unnamed protein product [Polarella glacialis]